MKRSLFVLLCVVVCVQVQAQERSRERARSQRTESRELKVTVRDTLGNRLDEVSVAAAFRGRPGLVAASVDRRGDRYFRVTETDTLDIFVLGLMFEFPAAGMDSLLIVSRMAPRNRPTQTDGRLEDVNYIAPVSVTATRRRETVDIGYGSMRPENLASWGNIVDMSQTRYYPDLLEYLPGRLGAGVRIASNQLYLSGGFNPPMLIVVDGIVYPDLVTVNTLFSLENIASIYIDKMGAIYGTRGAGGVLVITTKANSRTSK